MEPAFDRALEEELHKAFIAPARLALEQVLAAVDPLNLELLPWFDAVLLAIFAGRTICPLLETVVITN